MYVKGDLTNSGSISNRSFITDGAITNNGTMSNYYLSLCKNLTWNSGSFAPSNLYFNGAAEQVVTLASGLPNVSCTGSNKNLRMESDLIFSQLSLGGDALLNMNSHKLAGVNGGIISGIATFSNVNTVEGLITLSGGSPTVIGDLTVASAATLRGRANLAVTGSLVNNGNISDGVGDWFYVYVKGDLTNNGSISNRSFITDGAITNTGSFSPRYFGAYVRYLSIWDSRNPPNGWSDKFTNGNNGLGTMNFVPRIDGPLSSGFRVDYTLTNNSGASVSGSKDISGVNWATEGRYSGQGYANVYFQFNYPSATGTYKMTASLIDSYGQIISTIGSENTITFP
ncbi:MAG: hypothetical protein HQM09_08895 [Candidatus Riflebacteria bacterium]|nr:hypothetical protein [Candidatus Riflebacteria bacterium]